LYQKTLRENSGFFHCSFRTCDRLAVRNLADTWVKSKADLLFEARVATRLLARLVRRKAQEACVNTLVAFYISRPVQIDDDFKVTILFSLGGLMLSWALLSVNPEALAVLGAY
jgi:hypothetical protein